MRNIISSLWGKVRNGGRMTIVMGVIVIIVLITGVYMFRSKASAYQMITVDRRSIVETVSVTGNTTPISSVSIGFGNSGTIARTYSSIGKNVSQGQLLAGLNTSDLYAQVKQAEANVDIQQ